MKKNPPPAQSPSDVEAMLASALGKPGATAEADDAVDEPTHEALEATGPRRSGYVAIVGKPNVGKST